MAVDTATQNPSAVSGHKTVGRLIATGTGTTSGTTNTASLVTHSALDVTGAALTAANLKCLAIPTATVADPLWQGAAPTATQIDIRCVTVSVPYVWFLFHINS